MDLLAALSTSWPNSWQAALTGLIVVVALGMLLFVQRAPDMVMIGGVVLLMATGVLTPDEALKGMSNEGMLTVAALFVVAAAVERTGALAAIVDRALGRPTSLASAQLRTMVAPGILSAFMNNTPVVALMVPAIRDWARKHRLSVSKLLMPMNDAVVLGGLCTLIGTSTNVVVSGLVEDKTGRELGMGPMQAARSLHYVEGRVVMDASAQLALAIGAGVQVEWVTATDTEATCVLSRRGWTATNSRCC
jgi:Na+/H+ antiporter NhaD/arsenite permease-like protein